VLLDSLELAKLAVQACSDKKAADVVLLDLRRVSLVADFFVLCSGDTERQLRAILNEVVERVDAEGINPLHTEGLPQAGWILVDYGSVVVHIFAPQQRDYYRLDELWSDARPLVVMQ
jgi:ribosome-associated protein